jgi:hypothetical protein
MRGPPVNEFILAQTKVGHPRGWVRSIPCHHGQLKSLSAGDRASLKFRARKFCRGAQNGPKNQPLAFDEGLHAAAENPCLCFRRGLP